MATASNKQALVFVENVAQAWTAAPSHFALWNSATGTAASGYYGGGAISGSATTPGIGARVAFAVGGVSITVGGSGASDNNVIETEALNGIIDTALYVSLHSADPTAAAATAAGNEITRATASRNTARVMIASGSTGWDVTNS